MKFKNPAIYIQKMPDSIKLACLAFLLCLPLAALNSIPENDCAGRYAPMAEAFAAGQWEFAFHPLIPPLFPLASGMIAFVFGFAGFTAAKLASALFFSLAAIPLYGIFERVFDKKTAFGGTLLYVFCSHLLRLASSGLRDTTKCFVLFLAVYGIVLIFQNRKLIQGYLGCGLGCAGLALLRGDCLIYALLLLFSCVLLELFNHGHLRFPLRSILAMSVFGLLIFPWLMYEYKVIGYPVTETRIAAMLTKMENKLGIDWIYNENAEIRLPAKHGRLTTVGPFAGTGGNWKNDSKVKSGGSSFTGTLKSESNDKTHPQNITIDALVPPQHITTKDSSLSEFMSSFLKGFYPYFSMFAVPVVFFRIRQKTWSTAETIILIILLGHALLQVGQVAIGADRFYVSRRYLISAAPLAFGWSIMGLTWTFGFIVKRFAFMKNKPFQYGMLIFLLLLLLTDGAERTIKSYSLIKKKETNASILACTKWIRENYRGPYRYIESISRSAHRYDSGRRPVILTTKPAVKYFAQIPPHGKQMDLGPSANVVVQDPVDYVVLSSNSPEIDVTKYPYLEKVFSSGTGHHGFDIFSVRALAKINSQR